MSLVTIIAILVVGYLLLAVELLVLPGFGITGVLGLIALGVGSWAAWTEIGPQWGATIGALSFIVTILAVWIFPKTRAGKRMVLAEIQMGRSSMDTDASLVGKVGVTVTPCRPVGFARFAEREIEVVTEGSYLDPDTKVRIIQVEGTRVVVEAIPENKF